MDDAMREKIGREERALKEAAADLFIAWSEIESRMAQLLNQVIHDPEIAYRIYFAPTSAETRFKIVDVCVDSAFENSKRAVKISALWCRFRSHGAHVQSNWEESYTARKDAAVSKRSLSVAWSTGKSCATRVLNCCSTTFR